MNGPVQSLLELFVDVDDFIMKHLSVVLDKQFTASFGFAPLVIVHDILRRLLDNIGKAETCLILYRMKIMTY